MPSALVAAESGDSIHKDIEPICGQLARQCPSTGGGGPMHWFHYGAGRPFAGIEYKTGLRDQAGAMRLVSRGLLAPGLQDDMS